MSLLDAPLIAGLLPTAVSACGGDGDALRRVDPLQELADGARPDSAGLLAVGRDDPDFRPQAERVAVAARAAGMAVSVDELPGGHSWSIASQALARALPWISTRGGLTAN